MKTVKVKLNKNSYNIYIQVNILSYLATYLHKITTGKTVIIITDTNVDQLYAAEIVKTLTKNGYRVYKLSIPAGEQYKTENTVSKIYDWMLDHHFTREATIIALGGGVVGDLSGFVAATYMRGIPYIQIPTTLLAQVDSSVGGKVGINHKLGKNIIGAFYQPKLVIIDPAVLKTLPKRELYCGLAEIVKYSLILDRHLFKQLQNNFNNFILLNDWCWIEKIISRCCFLKSKIVNLDEKECGLRRILNFGHTIGHALETITRYSYFSHGEAITWGMLAAIEISFQKNYISLDDFQQIINLMDKIALSKIPASLNCQDILELILNDKKMSDSGLHFILLEGIGKVKIESIDKTLLLLGIEKIC